MKPFYEINQTDTAKKKLKNIAKNNNLPVEFVTTLYQFYYDLDPVRKNESIGWVSNSQYTNDQFEQGIKTICGYLSVHKEELMITKKELVTRVIKRLDQIDRKQAEQNFLIAGKTKNNCYLSEFSTLHYLNNYSEENLMQLERRDTIINQESNSQDSEEYYTPENFMTFLFVKVFRAGAIERGSLFYCYTDLWFDLPYEKQQFSIDNWIPILIAKINQLKEPTLSDLVKSCAGIIKGDKYFKQRILEALSYRGDLKVKNIDVSIKFLPFYKDELSSHFFSNEWRYPLRM